MKLSIIIPSLNGKILLEEMLPVTLKSIEGLDAEIIVVDNASTDGTSIYLHEKYPQIRCIVLTSNKGFTGACNAGADKAKGVYVLFLNNDCFITKKSIENMVSYLDTTHQVATQPIVYKLDKTVQNIGFVMNVGKAKAKEITALPERVETVWPPNAITFYGLSATCLLVKKDTFVDIGMFDTSFHSYLEDIDLMIRFAKKNLAYTPCLNATCVHKHMATSKKMGNYKQRRDFQNWIRIIAKHYTVGMLIQYGIPLFIERLRNINGIIKHIQKN